MSRASRKSALVDGLSVASPVATVRASPYAGVQESPTSMTLLKRGMDLHRSMRSQITAAAASAQAQAQASEELARGINEKAQVYLPRSARRSMLSDSSVSALNYYSGSTNTPIITVEPADEIPVLPAVPPQSLAFNFSAYPSIATPAPPPSSAPVVEPTATQETPLQPPPKEKSARTSSGKSGSRFKAIVTE